MEPMNLGSPVGSPSGQSPTSPYLPCFLTGEMAMQPTSPAKTPRQVHFAPSTPMGIPNSPAASAAEGIPRLHKNQREKAGGPPTVGLFDTLEVSSAVPSPCTTPHPQSAQLAPYTPVSGTPGGFSTPTQNVSLSGNANADDGERWVRVFGFPPSATSSVLGQFAQVGHMLEHRLPGQANWVDICFASRLDARRALAYNGRIIGGNIMIGVVPCKDSIFNNRNHNRGRFFVDDVKFYTNKKTMAGCSCNERNMQQPGAVLRDMTNMVSTPTTPRSPQVSRLSQRRLAASPASSLASPYPCAGRQLGFASPNDTQVIAPQNTPTKSTSFVTKAVDFVFGW